MVKYYLIFVNPIWLFCNPYCVVFLHYHKQTFQQICILSILLYHRLEYYNYIEPVEKRGFFKSIIISVLKPEIKYSILEKLTTFLINNEIPDEHYIFLISLLRVDKMYKPLFRSNYHRQIKRRMKPFINSEQIGKEIRAEIGSQKSPGPILI